MTLRTVSVILLEPVAVFEFGIAVEVFGIDRTEDGVPPFEFRICAREPGRPLQTKTTTGLSLAATHGLDAVAGSDLVIVAATPIRGDEQYPADVLDVLRAAHADGSMLMSLCSGAFVLAAAGVLDGRRCTTHWLYSDLFRERYPQVELLPDQLHVDDGDIITSAGTAAGIDASLHLVRRELGTAVATRMARRMVVPPQRQGGQKQFVQAPVPECSADSLAPLLSAVAADLGGEHSAESMARQAMMSGRTFARRFAAETGTTPHRWLVQQRVLWARTLLEESDLSVEQVADRVGFHSAVVLRNHFRREIGVSPSGYRRTFAA